MWYGGNDMIDIKILKKYTPEDQQALGLNGYVTRYRYAVSKEETAEETTIRIKLEQLNEPYKKRWPKGTDDFERYAEIISQGFSLGAYEDGMLVGILIAEKRDWNNTMWIAELEMGEAHRGRGIGSMLMEWIEQTARAQRCRIIGLEAQTLNVPAISFYRKHGFEIDGIDLSFYTNADVEKGEVALYMKKRLT
jgi:ribosomal protein S18 acetylase RimI-like enzyme